jgi:hypothetical protein
MQCSIPETDRDNSRQRLAKFCDNRAPSCACSTEQERCMCAMDAVSHGAVLEISRGSSAGNDDGDTTKGRLLRRAALRITWLLVLVLRNTSSSATPVDLTQGASRMAISRLVTDGDCLTPEPHLRFACGAPVRRRKRSRAINDRAWRRPIFAESLAACALHPTPESAFAQRSRPL